MVNLHACFMMMKKGIRKVQRKSKMINSATSITAASCVETDIVTAKKSISYPVNGGAESVPIGRPSLFRLNRRIKSEARIRDYLQSLSEQRDPASSPFPTTEASTSRINDQVYTHSLGPSENRRRRKSLTGIETNVPSIPPLRRHKTGLSVRNKKPLLKHSDTTQDLTTDRSEHFISSNTVLNKTTSDVGDIFGEKKETLYQESEIDIVYKQKVNSVLQRINAINIDPFFSKWKIEGFKHNKVLISKEAEMGEQAETKEVTASFVQYIKERDAARAETKAALEDLRETQCRLYDAMKEIDRLEKKTKGVKKPTNPPKKKPQAQSQNLKVPSAASGSSSGIGSARTSTANSVRTGIDGIYHPPIEGIEPDVDSCEYYWKLSELFPTLPMFYVLDAEKKFVKADLDYSGSIDKDELDKVLNETVGMFTPNQVDLIFKEVDANSSDYVDFGEVLTVLNKLYSRRKTNLPAIIQQNYSSTCSIQ